MTSLRLDHLSEIVVEVKVLVMTVYRQPGTRLTDHVFDVPLNHDKPDGQQIKLFAREVVASDKADDSLPWLLYLQGGPGMRAQRPVGRESWLDRALREFRVLLLDQRGTGRSTPANRQTFALLRNTARQMDYLTHFRADSIVRDAEIVRRLLIGDQPWSVLGQSFGGFCTLTYLSLAPDGLQEALITGGLPSLDAKADDVYRALYPQVIKKNHEHYKRYPADAGIAKQIARHIREQDVRLPSGATLTVEAFQSLGIMLGMQAGSHKLHYLLEDAFLGGSELTDIFLYQVQSLLTFAASPLYALLHESIYGQGSPATMWSAQRIRSEFPEFEGHAALDSDSLLIFTGEMIYPWMFETDPVLQPLRELANRLAEYDRWPQLYDSSRLASNEVPVAAVVYYDDMYVDRELSMQTANLIKGLEPWVTNEYQHDGLRESNGTVLDRLISAVRGA